MSGAQEWKKFKDAFKAATGKSKPKTKIFGVAIKTTGLEKAFKAVDLMPTYQAKVAALHVLAAQASAYMKTLQKEAEAVSKKSDPDYVAAVVNLARGLASAVTKAKSGVTDHLWEQIRRIKTRKIADFRKYCEKEMSGENLDLAEEILKARTQADLKRLYDTYVKSNLVNVPAKTVKLCKEALADEAQVAKALKSLENETFNNLADTYARYSSTLKLPSVVSPI